MRQRRTAPLILELDLTEGLTEEPPTDPLSALIAMRRPRLTDVLDGLRRARADDRVKALVVKVGGRQVGLARIQELRDAGGSSAGTASPPSPGRIRSASSRPGTPYYLATAFDPVYLQPSGELALTGIGLEQLFYRGAMDKSAWTSGRQRNDTRTPPTGSPSRASPGARGGAQQLAISVTGHSPTRSRDGWGSTRARPDPRHRPVPRRRGPGAGLVDALGYRDEVYDDVQRAAGPDALPALPQPLPAVPHAGRAGPQADAPLREGVAHSSTRPARSGGTQLPGVGRAARWGQRP